MWVRALSLSNTISKKISELLECRRCQMFVILKEKGFINTSHYLEEHPRGQSWSSVFSCIITLNLYNKLQGRCNSPYSTREGGEFLKTKYLMEGILISKYAKFKSSWLCVCVCVFQVTILYFLINRFSRRQTHSDTPLNRGLFAEFSNLRVLCSTQYDLVAWFGF